MDNPPKSFDMISSAMKLTGGFTLSQLAEISGLETTTIQNWVKRGWIEPPKDRRYGEESVARVLVINMLKGVMQLSDIVSLLSYVNGKVDDRTDDAIPDGELYNLLCSVTAEIDKTSFDIDEIDRIIAEKTKNYVEPFPKGKEKLCNAIKVMMLAHISSKLKKQAQDLLASVLEN